LKVKAGFGFSERHTPGRHELVVAIEQSILESLRAQIAEIIEHRPQTFS
jgi:hypothetical protein